jgi:hypothetical protein
MKARIIPVLAITLSIASVASPVRAQIPAQPNSNTPEYQLTGDSLEGIGNRSAQNDFSQFFNTNTSINDRENNQIESRLRLNRSISLPNTPTPVILQPAQQSETDDALQLQLDLENR